MDNAIQNSLNELKQAFELKASDKCDEMSETGDETKTATKARKFECPACSKSISIKVEPS